MLARMHLAGRDFPRHQPNLRGLDWWVETVPVVVPYMDADARRLIEDELVFQRHLAETAAYQALPRGPVHADLFRDNVMFDGPVLSGFFDFYFAGVDTWLFDLAVCLNDWCIDLPTGVHHAERAQAMGEALKRELGDALTFTQPQGGLFFWANLTGAGGKLNDGAELAKRAIEKGVAFVPGAPFYASNPDLSTLRLSFATADVAKIEEGVGRLGQAV